MQTKITLSQSDQTTAVSLERILLHHRKERLAQMERQGVLPLESMALLNFPSHRQHDAFSKCSRWPTSFMPYFLRVERLVGTKRNASRSIKNIL